MNEQTRSVALVVAGLAFVVFLLVKMLARPAPSGPIGRQGRDRIDAAVRRARDRSLSSVERAAAFREAASIALESQRPGLAASYARRAERLEPDSAETVSLLASAMRKASRFRALERLLWRHLAQAEPNGLYYQRTLGELVDLYAGPLRRNEIAAALRRIAAQKQQ
jgi:hypothetical protein